MTWLLSAAGREAVGGLAARRTLLAFDFDGTLAPIVRHPADAEVASATAARLRGLAARWPIAVITGRTCEDAAPRLGFAPHYLFGNHGAQRAGAAPSSNPLHNALDCCRGDLRTAEAELLRHAILVEDKGLSIALHYRGSHDPGAARAWLDRYAARLAPGVRASAGHCVLNLTPAGADDKGDALLRILRDCDADASLVVGDDVNDEPAFAKAPQDSVNVRIATPDTATLARFRLFSQSSVNTMLDLLLSLRS